MMALLLAAQIVTASVPAGVLVWNGPPLTPAEAARILEQSPGLSNRTHVPAPVPDGPQVVIVPGAATEGPFGAFASVSPFRRLNDTRFVLPPARSDHAWPALGRVRSGRLRPSRPSHRDPRGIRPRR